MENVGDLYVCQDSTPVVCLFQGLALPPALDITALLLTDDTAYSSIRPDAQCDPV
jgi:hypothetical protein